jgi:hypothetical protein
MNGYLVYLDLPPVPEELIESVDTIINSLPKPTNTLVPSNFTYFETRHVSNTLLEWSHQTFKDKVQGIKYQIIKPNIPIHKDIGRTVAFNYVIQTGGENSATCFFDDNKKLLFKEIVPANHWHRIRTDMYHTVAGINSLRIAISVVLKDYTWNDSI